MTDLNQPFLNAFKGGFLSMLRWPQLEELWQNLREQDNKSWYIYAVGETPPLESASHAQLEIFLGEIDKLLKTEHQEDYCGIVYVDDKDDPAFVKIYDPNNLGVSCGFSDSPPLPGWILSCLQPVDLQVALPQPGNRRRWWQKLFNSSAAEK